VLSKEGQMKLAEMLLSPPNLPKEMENLLKELLPSQQGT